MKWLVLFSYFLGTAALLVFALATIQVISPSTGKLDVYHSISIALFCGSFLCHCCSEQDGLWKRPLFLTFVLLRKTPVCFVLQLFFYGIILQRATWKHNTAVPIILLLSNKTLVHFILQFSSLPPAKWASNLWTQPYLLFLFCHVKPPNCFIFSSFLLLRVYSTPSSHWAF